MKFSARIKTLRTDQGLSLDALASRAGASKSYIWELENKDPPRPSADKLSAIARALGVTVDYLYGRDPQALGTAEDRAFFQFYSAQPVAVRTNIRAVAKVLASSPAG